MVTSTHERRLRLAALTSSVGAGVLGIGIGVLFAAALEQVGIAIALAGGLMHVWGMLDKRRIELAAGAARPWWAALLYWLCWIALAGLAAFIGLRGVS